MVVLAGCSTNQINDTELALKCTELYMNRAEMNPMFFELELLYSGSEGAQHQIWYDKKYGACIYAYKYINYTVDYATNEGRDAVVYGYIDLENDRQITTFDITREEEEEADIEKAKLFSDNIF